jgi:Protein of unknown function (DUF1579)
MNTKLKLFALIFGTALLCAPLMAKEKSAKKDKKGADAAMAMDPEMMKKYMAYATPGEAHKALTPLVGTFMHTIKWWNAPDTKPDVSTGTTDAQWILGGRFVESIVTGTSMGQPFEGRGFMGYDNEKKQYDGFWLDNMGTGVMTSHGQYDAATKTWNENATASCPLEGTKHFRGVTRVIDDNNHTYELFTNDKNGKEFRMMEITYVRKP